MKALTRAHPLLMGILNITEDSFSDGNQYLSPDKAISHALQMQSEGADIIDIGAESTRPGANPVAEETELKRLIPVLKALKDNISIPISIDTTKSKVALEAIEAGASIINDISALSFDPLMGGMLAAHKNIDIVLMHMQGTPKTMQKKPQYHDVVTEIYAFFEERLSFCDALGISKDRIILDPGIGFGKTLDHNLDIINSLARFKELGCRVLLGASRKSFISYIYPSDAQNRLGGSLSAALIAHQNRADIIRIHDVSAHKQFFGVLSALEQRDRL